MMGIACHHEPPAFLAFTNLLTFPFSLFQQRGLVPDTWYLRFALLLKTLYALPYHSFSFTSPSVMEKHHHLQHQVLLFFPLSTPFILCLWSLIYLPSPPPPPPFSSCYAGIPGYQGRTQGPRFGSRIRRAWPYPSPPHRYFPGTHFISFLSLHFATIFPHQLPPCPLKSRYCTCWETSQQVQLIGFPNGLNSSVNVAANIALLASTTALIHPSICLSGLPNYMLFPFFLHHLSINACVPIQPLIIMDMISITYFWIL